MPADDNTAFDQADADTATSSETTSQYNPTTENWQGTPSTPEAPPSNAAEGSVNTGNDYTSTTTDQKADIFEDMLAEDSARDAASNAADNTGTGETTN